jgi:nucleoside-diphosphate-sugar epimerase
LISAVVEYTFAEISMAGRLLGYEPKVSVAEGTRRFFEWYLAQVRKGSAVGG